MSTSKNKTKKSVESLLTLEEEERFSLITNDGTDIKEARNTNKNELSNVKDTKNVETENNKNEILDEIKKEAISSFIEIKHNLIEQYLEFRNQLFKGQKVIKMMSQIATANIILVGILNCLYGLVLFNFTLVFMSIYTITISIIILLLELSRKKRISKLQTLIRIWFKFLELSTGRGIIQILLSTMTLFSVNSIYFSIMGLFMGFVGLVNVTFGILAASKLRKIKNLLRYYGSKDIENINLSLNFDQIEFKEILVDKEQDPEYKLRKIHRLFETLDEDGNGYIDKEELFNGLLSLKLPFELSLSEIDIIFEHLDRDKNNQISVEELEYWFISKKCPYFIL